MLKNSFLKGVSKIVGWSLLGQLFLLAITPIVTRLYQPEHFGVFSSFFALASIFGVLVCCRYELALPLTKTDSELSSGVLAVSLINITLSLLSTLGLAVFMYLSPATLPFDQSYLIWLFLIVLFIGFFRTSNYIGTRYGLFGKIGQAKFAHSFSNGACQLGAGMASPSGEVLIISYFAGQVAFILRVFQATKEKVVTSISRLRAGYFIRKYKKFPMHDLPGAILDVVSANILLILFSVYFSPLVAGFYLLAERVLFIPVNLLSQSISQVYINKLSSEEVGGGFSIKLALVLSVVATVGVLIVTVMPANVYIGFFGESWSGVVAYLPFVAIIAGCQLLYSPMSMVLITTGGQVYSVYIHSSLLFLKVASVYLGYKSDDPIQAVTYVAIATFIVYSISTLFILRRASRFYRA